MRSSMLHAILVIGVLSAGTAMLAQGTTQPNPNYNPDKQQTPNSKPGSRTQDGLMGITGTTGMQGATGTKGNTGPTGRMGTMGHTGK